MTVDKLIEDLKAISSAGGGKARVVIEEVGEGYFGDLLSVDTWLVTPGDETLTLLGSRPEES